MRRLIFSLLILITSSQFILSQSNNPADWIPVTSYQYSMQGYIKVNFGGSFIDGSSSILAAFVGTECRGKINPTTGGPFGTYFGLNISSSTNGDQISFKVFDDATNQVYDIDTVISFMNGSNIGSFVSHEIFTAYSIGNEPNWDPNTQTQYNMNGFAVVEFPDGSLVFGSGSKVGVFDDTTCVGLGEISTGPVGQYYGVSIYSNQISLPGLSFKFYNSNTDSIYDIIETIDFISGSTFGSIINPDTLHILSQISTPLSVTESIVNASCYGGNDGAIDINVSGGEIPYSFIWSNGATTEDLIGIVAGNYSVTITDNQSNSTIENYSVSQPVEITNTISASICDGDNYVFGTQTLSSQGLYLDTLTAINGCDSIITLILTVNPEYSFSENTSICDGETYSWQGNNYTTTGVYSANYQAISGCDSSFTLNLTVHQNSNIVINQGICDNETLAFGGQNLNIGGTYYDTMQTTAGCDSIITLNLSVSSTYSFTENHTICSGEIYNWRGTDYSIAGLYYDSLQTISACDSVFELNLTVNSVFSVTETASICNGENYLWHGNTYSQAGTYYDSLISINACDSVFELLLTVNSVYSSIQNISICDNETFTFGGQNLSIGGTYYDTLQTNAGCDSIITLNLSVNPTYSFTENHSICSGDIYNWHGTDYSVAGTYYDSLLTASSCDSVYELNLVVNQIYLNNESVSICDGNSYMWNGNTYTQAGTYMDTLLAINGCDSIITLTLTVNSIQTSGIITNPICFGQAAGAIDLSILSGSSPYSFVWSDGSSVEDLTNIHAGTYIVTVSDQNFCTSIDSFIVSQPQQLLSTVSETNISCNGLADGEIDLTVTGGTTPYSFVWSNGAFSEDISGLSDDFYIVYITDDNGCFTINIGEVEEPPALILNVINTNVLCNGQSDGTAEVIVSGGIQPYTFNWSEGSTDATIGSLSTGSYSVTVSDANNCSEISSVTISEPSVLQASMIVVNGVVCDGVNNGELSSTATGGTSPYTYAWSNSLFGNTITNLSAGTYTLTVSDANLCTSVTSAQINNSLSLPFAEDFEGSVNGWTFDSDPNSVGWVIGDSVFGDPMFGFLEIPPHTRYAASNDDMNDCFNGICNLAYNDLIISPSIGLSGSNITLSFDAVLPDYGFATSTANVLISVDGGGFILIDSLPNSSVWYNHEINLSAYTGNCDVRIAFQHNDLGDWGTFFAIDNVNISSDLGYDLSADNWLSPVNTICPSVAEQITVEISNLGSENIGTYEVVFLFSNDTLGIEQVTDTIYAGTTIQYSSQNLYSFVQSGSHNISFIVNLAGDGDLSNNSLQNLQLDIHTPINSFAYLEDFEDGLYGDFELINGQNSNANIISDNGDLSLKFSGTISGNWQNVDLDSSWIYNIENQSVFNTVCPVDGSGGSLQLSFDLRQEFTNSAEHSVFGLFINGQLVGDVNGTKNFIAFTNTSDPYQTITYDLSAYSGNSFNLEFRTVCFSPQNVVLIDNVLLDYIPVDFSAIEILSPASSCGMSQENISFSLQNNSLIPVQNIMVYYQLNNSIFVQEIISDTISGGSIYTYTFNTPADFSLAGYYDLKVWLSVNGDANSANDTSEIQITSLPTIGVFPFSEDFEGLNYWFTEGTNPSWESGPSQNSGNTSMIWSSTLSGNYNNNEDSWLESPCFDFSSLSNPVIGLSLWYEFDNLDFALLEFSQDGGQNWTTFGDIGFYGNPFGSWIGSSNGWTTREYEIDTNLISMFNSIQFRIRISSDASGVMPGISVDDFRIYELFDVQNNITNASCFGIPDGSIDLSVSGGFIPYHYLWSNGETVEDLMGLSVGSYDVTVWDMDSVNSEILNFVISEPVEISSQISAEICDGDSYLLGGQLLTSQGVYVDTFASINACDSIVTLNLNVNPTYNIVENHSICDGEILSWQGNDYTASGTYFTNYTSLSACDSSYTLNLTVNQVYTSNEIASVCDGDSYLWHGNSYTQAGTYYDTLSTANGCDSIFVLDLTVLLTQNNSISETICDGDSYLFNNQTLTAAGVYSATFVAANGCDSVVTLNLSVSQLPQASLSVTDVNCFGGTNGQIDVQIINPLNYDYVWSNGASVQNISGLSSGIYTVTITNINNCVNQFSASVSEPSQVIVSGIVSDVVCNGDTSGAIDVSVSGGVGPYSYLWSNNSTSEDLQNIPAGAYQLTLADQNSCIVIENYIVGEPNVIQISSSQNNVSCYNGNDGWIAVSADGGTSPYSFVWSNNNTSDSIANLASGEYTITITDINGCSGVDTFEVLQPDSISVLESISHVVCYGEVTGTINLNVSGGTQPYIYNWNNSSTDEDISNLVAGDYSLTITDNNACVKYVSYEILQPDTSIYFVENLLHPGCFGQNNGAINISVFGGANAYDSLLWSNGSTQQNLVNLVAGNYSVTVWDVNGCESSTQFTLVEPDDLTASIIQTQNNLCSGDSNAEVQLTVSGGTLPYEYLWSNGVTLSTNSNLIAGEYYLTVTDSNGCSISDSFNVSSPEQIVLSEIITNVSVIGGSDGAIDLTVSGGTMPYTYTWTDTLGQTFSNTQDIINLSQGIYNILLTDAYGCTASATYIITEPTNLLLNFAINDVSCNGYSDGEITVSASGGVSPYSYTWILGSTSQTITSLPAGTYIVIVTDASSTVTIGSAIVNQPDVLEATVLLSNPVSCNGFSDGELVVQASGGTAGYSFVWNNGVLSDTINNLAAGVYSVTTEDQNQCQTIADYTLNEPDNLIISVSEINSVLCFGDSNASLNTVATGGTQPYTYNWSTSETTQDINGIGSGNYTVTVSDFNSCEEVSSYFVSEPNQLFVNIQIDNEIACHGGNDGEISAIVTGGLVPYIYFWNNGSTSSQLTALVTGQYSVLVKDSNACPAVDTIILNEPDELLVSANTINASCFGNSDASIDLTVSGGTTPYNFIWSDGSSVEDLINITAGNYSVTITDNNLCSVVNNYSVFQAPDLLISLIQTQETCQNDSTAAIDLSFSGGTSPYQINWSNGSTMEDLVNVSSGDYSITIIDNNMCQYVDSISIFDNPVYNLSVSNSICNGDVLNFGSQTLVSAGVFTENFASVSGCDSTVTLTLSIDTVYSFIEDYSICDGDELIWQNDTFTQTGSYTAQYLTTNGCDSVYTLNLTTEPISNFVDYVSICDGESYNWQGNVYSTGGTYSQNYTSASGCDSNYTLILNVDPVYNYTESATICDGDTYLWQGNFYNSTGIYFANFQTINGCDSVYMLDLDVLPVSSNTISMSICEGDTYSFNGQILDSTGTYIANYFAANGCDSIVTLNLSVVSPISNSITVNICDGETFSFGTQLLNSTGIYTETFVAQSTCDSIVTLSLFVNTSYNISNQITICSGDSVLLGGQYQTSAGVYYDSLMTANGCDSIIVTTVSVSSPQLNSIITEPLCNGDNTASIDLSVSGGISPYSYIWSNSSTTEDLTALSAGNYTITVDDNIGCQLIETIIISEPTAVNLSAVVIDVTQNNGSNGSIDLTVTGGVPPYIYQWSSNLFPNLGTNQDLFGIQQGTYTVIVTDNNTCSTTQTFVVNEPSAISLNYNIQNVSCYDNSDGEVQVFPSGGVTPYTYLWLSGETTSTVSSLVAGTYFVFVSDSNSDLLIGSVTVTEPDVLNSVISLVNSIQCSGDATGELQVNVSGGTQPYTYSWSNGLTDSLIINLSEGVYQCTVTDANGCQSISTYSISSNPVFDIILNESICDGEIYNFGTQALNTNGVYLDTFTTMYGCDSIVTLNLSVNPVYDVVETMSICDGNVYSWQGNTYTIAGTYFASYQTINGCDSNFTLNLTVNPVYDVIETMSICDGDVYNWQGNTYTTAGTYFANYQTISGCDSNFTLNLTVNPVYDVIETMSICDGDIFSWQGNTYTTAGTYFANYQTISGCDSNFTLNLTVNTLPVISAIITDNTIVGASDGTIDLTVVGNSPFVFSWSNGATTEDISGLASNFYSVAITDALGCSITDLYTVSQPNDLVITLFGTNVSVPGASDGLIDLSVTGGLIPYSYQWSDGSTLEDIINVPGGWYYVTVSDLIGNTVSDSIEILEPALLVASGIVTNVSCFGESDGAIDLSISGGLSPYSYLWNSGQNTEDISNIAAGNYQVVVFDSNNNFKILNFIVTEPDEIIAVEIIQNVSCYGLNDGSVSINMNSGTSPFTYNWSNSETNANISGLTSGGYNLTVTDNNGCSAEFNYLVSEPDGLLVSGIVTDETCELCNDGAIDLSVIGGVPGYNYSWSNNSTLEDIVGLDAGVYFVTVNDANNCSEIISFEVFTEDSVINQTIPIVQGWNWISFNVLPADQSADSVFANYPLQLNDIVKTDVSLGGQAQYFGQWFPPNYQIKAGVMYLFYTDQINPPDLIIEGYAVDPLESIPIVNGWNWVGYLPQNPMMLDTALQSLNSSTGDIIKTSIDQGGQFEYFAGQWFPPNGIMKPGVGYLLNSSVTDTLIYPLVTSTTMTSKSESIPSEINIWENPKGMQYVNGINAVIYLGDNRFDISNSLLGIFKNNECRGFVEPFSSPYGDQFLLSVSSDLVNEENLHYSLYDAKTEKYYTVVEEYDFNLDNTLGSVSRPIVLHIIEESNSTDWTQNESLSCQAYPNPFKNRLALNIMLPENGELNVSIYNPLGQLIKVLKDEMTFSGEHFIIWDGQNYCGELVKAGNYFVQIRLNDTILNYSLIKLD